MNRYQKAIATIAALNLLLLLMFPPFLDSPMQRGVLRNFESFYFVLMAPHGRIIYQDLLTIEVLFVIANAMIAWLVLNPKDGGEPSPSEMTVATGLLLFGIANLAVIFLFPPFQPYPSMVRSPPEGFEGFYFILGDKRHRHFFAPMLYLEVILIVINLLVTWLVFGLLRGSVSEADQHLIEELHHIPPEKANVLVHAIEEEAHPHTGTPAKLGRKEERRKRSDPRYKGPERRIGRDRRHDLPKA